MKKRTRILGFVLALVMAMCSVVVLNVPVSAQTISTASALETALENGIDNIVLDEDIDMSGRVVTSASVSGLNFNGGGHVIKNLTTTRGLYNALSGNSSITNLGLYNCTVIDFPGSTAKQGYGLIVGLMTGGTISGCFADGSITVYGSDVSCVGGLVGSVSGSVIIADSAAMCDIDTNASYVGGLIGRVDSATSISQVYSTGNINNIGKNYIGGLFGYSAYAISNAYTTTFIKNAYADTVKAIGCMADGVALPVSVYYDRSISLQRQDDLDTARDVSDSISGFTTYLGFYPQNDTLAGYFPELSRVSAVRVDLNLERNESGLLTSGTGREYMPLSTTTEYTYATLTLPSNGNFSWHISGGVDEYYFDPANANNLQNAYGANPTGLSGNAYDSVNGKYLFVSLGDVGFTARAGKYERTITVHVTNENPYFANGTGLSATAPFSISNLDELNNVRLYCLDGEYNYSLDAAVLDMSAAFLPINAFKGSFNGNGNELRSLNVREKNGGSAGLFSTVTGSATISGLHISNASVTPSGTDSAGILVGKTDLPSGKSLTVNGVLVSGTVSGAANAGSICGSAANTTISGSIAMGRCTATVNAGGVVGSLTSGSVADCYSTTVVNGNAKAGGLIGDGDSTGTYSDSIFTGMVYGAGIVKGITAGSGTGTNGYYDKQAACVDMADSKARSTTEIKALNFSGWTQVANNYPVPNTFADYASKPNNIKRAVALAIAPVTYRDDSYTGVVTSKSFLYATVPAVDGVTLQSLLLEGTSVYGYSSGTYTKQSRGGENIFKIYTASSGAGTGYCVDYRCLRFDSKSINLHIKYTVTGTDYTLDKSGMYNIGLAGLTNELSDKYNISFKNADVYSVMSIRYPTDILDLSVILPAKGYAVSGITASTAESGGSTLPVTDSRINISGAVNNVYVNVTLMTGTLPWGVYRVNCRGHHINSASN